MKSLIIVLDVTWVLLVVAAILVIAAIIYIPVLVLVGVLRIYLKAVSHTLNSAANYALERHPQFWE
jgi:fatty acid desaturase